MRRDSRRDAEAVRTIFPSFAVVWRKARAMPKKAVRGVAMLFSVFTGLPLSSEMIRAGPSMW
jgi:hypothetical protein